MMELPISIRLRDGVTHLHLLGILPFCHSLLRYFT